MTLCGERWGGYGDVGLGGMDGVGGGSGLGGAGLGWNGFGCVMEWRWDVICVEQGWFGLGVGVVFIRVGFGRVWWVCVVEWSGVE